MKNFRTFVKDDIRKLTFSRKFETRIGELVTFAAPGQGWTEAIGESPSRFVVAGIPEDIGVRANGGAGGAGTAWEPFLDAFLNMQSNDFLEGGEILLLGAFDFSEVTGLVEQHAHGVEERRLAYRHALETVDDEVEKLVKAVTECGKIPILIGGGHNNAYPCIKGSAKGLNKAGLIDIAQINVINLDAHTHYGPAEGRHSGNPFRYAEDDGYLEKYCILGVHENQLPQNTWIDIVNNPFTDIITYEDIFVHGKRSFTQAISDAIDFTDDTYCGIELDLDSVPAALTASQHPSGVTALQARQYVARTAAATQPAYLHISEGATVLETGQADDHTGKLIAYLVSDFIKAIP